MTVDFDLIARILEIIVIIAGGLKFLADFKAKIDILISERDDEHKDNIERFVKIEEQLKRLVDLNIELVRQESRLNAIDTRLKELNDRVDEIKRRQEANSIKLPAKRPKKV